MGAGRRFNLLRELGSGAFGTVYLAEMESQGGFKKNVAVKLLNPELSSYSEASQRLRDEARLLGRLRHRHIVGVDDLVRLDGRWAVVMEHIEGCDLEVLMTALQAEQGRVPVRAALEIARAIAIALDVAFTSSAGTGEPLRVVHRDIKPSNVRLTAEGEVKVLDFGIARADFSEREAKTGRVRYGSIGYMSPERLLGEPEVAAADVYAVGCVLYELITGQALGRAELGPKQQEEQVHLACQALQQVGGSQELAQLMAETLAYEPDERPEAGVVAERLRALVREAPGQDLHEFAAAWIPRVPELVDDQTRPARGVLEEETGGTSSNLSEISTDGQAGANPTLVFDDILPEPTQGHEGQEPVPAPEPPSRTPLYAGVAVALLLVLGGGGWFLSQQPEAELPPEVAVESEPAPEPEPHTPAVVQVEPAPEPEAVVEEPVQVAPQPRPQRVQKPQPGPAPEPSPAPVEAPPAADAPLLRAVKFSVAGASSVSASCGSVSGTGASSALLREVPAGACSVTATVDGAELSTSVQVDKPRGVECVAQGGTLSCS